MRCVLYRFPDLDAFARVVDAAGIEAELALPPGETVDDGEWVLAVFELGPARRAASAAGRGWSSPDGAKLTFEPRDMERLQHFAAREAKSLPPPAEGAGRGSRPTLPSGRVMIVDDDPDIRGVVATMLQAVGLTVIAVESGEEALDRIALEACDLLVLDWNLPRMTGLDLCRALRKDPSYEALPVLFLTANASSQDMVEAFASGGDDYVVKPFRAPELGARIFSLLRRARKAAS